MLISQKLLLLLLKDSGAKEAQASMAPVALRAALLVDLALAGRVSISEDRRRVVRIVSTAPTGSPVLDGALSVLTAKDGRRLNSIAQWQRFKAMDLVAQSLVSEGVLARTAGGLFGWFTLYPTLDPAPEAAVRSHLEAVVVGTLPPDDDDRVLLGVLNAMGMARYVLPAQRTGLAPRQLRRRIKELSEGEPASAAVAEALAAAAAVVVAASSMAATSSG